MTRTTTAKQPEVSAYDDSPEAMLARPVFACDIYNGDDEHVARIVAHSTAEALATHLDRLPERGRIAYAHVARSLHRKNAEALRRWDQHGSTFAGRSQLVCQRKVAHHAEDDPIWWCHNAGELPTPLPTPTTTGASA